MRFMRQHIWYCGRETRNLCAGVTLCFAGKLVGSRVHTTPGSLQRSRSDIDVNAASSAKSRLSTVPASSPFSSAAALPPGSYASLGNKKPHM